MRDRGTPWSILAPLPAAALGAAFAVAHGVRWAAHLPNFAAHVLGAAVARMMWGASRDTLAAWMPGVSFALILATLIGPDMDGVHRWLGLGSLRLNVSSALAPWLLYGLSAKNARVRNGAVLAAIGAQLVHLAQPDAGQATALAAGMVPLVLDRSRHPRSVGILVAIISISIATFSWSMHDALPAIDHVERVLTLGAARGATWTVALVLSGAALLVPFIAYLRRRPTDAAIGLSAALYLCASFVVTFVGNFPVPVFGAGAGPVLGWYALVGLVATHAGRSAAPRASDPNTRTHGAAATCPRHVDAA